MSALSTELRNKLERTCIAARNLAERAATDALESLAVAHHEPYGHMTPAQRTLRNKLWARAKQLGDTADAKGQRSIDHLAQECAYEQWHRMLFARFLAENNLLMLTEDGEKPVAVSLEEVKELAKDAKTNLWALAGRFAQTMLPEIFRADDPVLQVPLAREDQIKLEQLLDALAKDTFTASDSLGWCYQFWQTERKDQVNAAGNKIGADELPSVTQLFTEDYMVDFLLDNTLGAWHAGKVLATNPKLAETARSEDELRKAVALPGCPWKYLRFIKGNDGKWTPAAGTFDGWPKTAKEIKTLDPCCGSGHFIVAMFERVVALRMAEQKLDETAAVQAAIRENIFGLELDPRCAQIGAFSLALAAWRRVGHCALPAMHLACSGLAPNTREADWLKLAGDNDKLQRGMARLYRLFKDAPALGSLINPHAGGDLLEAGFQELRPLLEKALVAEKTSGYLREGVENPTDLEMAVTAQGIAKAAEILAGQFTLVATNVPYLGRGKQDDVLMDYCERVHPDSKADLSTCFVERCLDFCDKGGSTSLVTPQNWLFLGQYKKFRESLLTTVGWKTVVRLGARAFETITGEVVNVALLVHTKHRPTAPDSFLGLDVSEMADAVAKRGGLLAEPVSLVNQLSQLKNPDARIIQREGGTDLQLLSERAVAYQGLVTGDRNSYIFRFWEIPRFTAEWETFADGYSGDGKVLGRENIIFWEKGRGRLYQMAADNRDRLHDMHESGNLCWGKKGVLLTRIGLRATPYYGERFDNNLICILPFKEKDLPALWNFCSSSDYQIAVRELDQKLSLTNATACKVGVKLEDWLGSDGFPKAFSSDPTQSLFNGHPAGADQPLQVAVARLLGYQWPRQTGSSFPDCPALGPDGLEKLADDDGIVCIPSVRGEEPAAERLRKFLRAAYGTDWKSNSELALIHGTSSKAGDFDEWLRDEFFEEHCGLFQQRPFVWHIWDGRKRDGFHALVNYHTLASGDKGRRTLENLTHSYLGEWITRQKDSQKRGEEGADERLAAALALKEKLEAILTGEPPFDVFVRWKPLAQQAIGWQPDINDGVRMNIRPFATADILRKRVKIKWEKDRGSEPKREKSDFPWFWKDGVFTGERLNEVHLTKEQKEKARK
jgi:hypothetical protein